MATFSIQRATRIVWAAVCALTACRAEKINVLTCNLAHVPDTAIVSAKADAARIFLDIGVQVTWFDCTEELQSGATTPVLILRIRHRAPAGLPGMSATEIMGKAYIAPNPPSIYADIYCESVQGFAQTYRADLVDVLGYAIAHKLGHLLLGSRHTARGLMSGNWGVDELRSMRQHALRFGSTERVSIRRELQARATAALARPNE